MPKTLHAFEHYPWTFRKGEDVPDDHPMVALAPHLFDLPEPELESEPEEPVRIRGPLVDHPSPKTTKKGA